MQGIIGNFEGRDVRIYLLDKGLQLPENLVLIHEHSDHFSLQGRQIGALKGACPFLLYRYLIQSRLC